jgi:hypothetical protein
MDGRQFKSALKHGYRSGLEIKIKEYLKEHKVPIKYEKVKIEWEDLMYRTYTPDFILPNGIIIEVKGRFTSDDRRKHLAVKKQHPNLDIRFVFESSNRKLSKGAKTTYGQWCEKHGMNNYLPTDYQAFIQAAMPAGLRMRVAVKAGLRLLNAT